MKYSITFNTNRPYTSRGQEITVRQEIGENGEQLGVIFHDHSRTIWGQIDAEYSADESLESFVMRHYDAGNYSPHPEAGSLEINEY